MSWVNFEDYGESARNSLLNIAAMCVDQDGTIECQVRPVLWEDICRDLGATRPVQTEYADGKAAFTSCAGGRIFRFYAVAEKGLDYRFRVVRE